MMVKIGEVMYAMSDNRSSDKDSMMSITSTNKITTPATQPETSQIKNALTKTAVTIISLAMVAVLVLGIIIGVKMASPPSDKYHYGSMQCWEIAQEQYEMGQTAINFRDPEIVKDATRRLDNLNDWWTEKGC